VKSETNENDPRKATNNMYRVAKRYVPAGGSLIGHIDGAATWRMLLKQRQRRLRCRFCHFRWPYGNADKHGDSY